MEIKNRIKNRLNKVLPEEEEFIRIGYYFAGAAVGIASWTLACRMQGFRMSRPLMYVESDNGDNVFFMQTPFGKILASREIKQTD